MSKKLLVIFCIMGISAASLCADDTYKITDIYYDITGITNQYVIAQNVPIDQDRIFLSENELIAYIADLRIKLASERVFESTSINYTIVPATSDKTFNSVKLYISTKDSYHFIGVPYVNYNSNDGLTFKLKAKDMNFLGTMEPMSSQLTFKLAQDSETEPIDYVFGGGITIDYPFKLLAFDASWNNDDSITYTIGDKSPEWNLSTGIDLTLPFKTFSLRWSFTQKAIRDFDYTKYDDDTYYTEEATFSVPFDVQNIDNWGKVQYTPYFSYKWNWDQNGISLSDSDLISPVYTVGHTISTSRVDWRGNFRNGLSVSATQSFSYNSTTQNFTPYISCEMKEYKALKYIGFCTDIYVFSYINGSEKIGSRLRGIRDDQYFSTSSGYSNLYACRTPSALVVNMDMPIHILTTDWEHWGLKFLHSFNFEFQISPFTDFALMYNNATKTTMSYKDGFYSAGVEFLVYPLKWRSIQVRASVGVDVGRKFLSSKLNTSWRANVSPYEYSFGIGLHY